MSLQRISELRKELRETIEKEGDKALKEEFQRLFDAMPRLKAFTWNQYTPIFNDGDVCSFTVDEVMFSVADVTKEGGERWKAEYDDDDEESEHSFCSLSHFRYSEKEANKYNLPSLQEVEVMDQIEDIISSHEETLEFVFQSGVQVTLYRDGRLEVEDYYHD